MIVSNFYKNGERRFSILSDCDEETEAKIKEYYTRVCHKDVSPEFLEKRVLEKFNVKIKILKQWT